VEEHGVPGSGLTPAALDILDGDDVADVEPGAVANRGTSTSQRA